MSGFGEKPSRRKLLNKKDFINRFTNLSRVKKGGQKVVYKAMENGRWVAVKLIYNSDDPRILQEIEIVQNMNIRNVPHILEKGYITDESSGEQALYIIEEFIIGNSLRDLLNQGKKFNLTEAYKLLEELLLIEIELENSSLLHRDINPNNIMIDNASGSVHLIDFGLAKILNGKQITCSNAINGPFTPGYAPNEQIANKRMEQDVRTDLYQIGVTIYEMCSGINPFVEQGDNVLEIVYKTITVSPAYLKLNGDKNGLFAQLINIMMAKSPSQRPDTAQKALSYLRAIKSSLELEE